MPKLGKSQIVSIDEVLRIALARTYSSEIAQHILSARASHPMVEVTPQGKVYSYSRSDNLKFSSMPVGTLFISYAAWLRLYLAGPWIGLPTDHDVSWKHSLAFLLLARDLRDPTQCQFFDLAIARELWERHDHEA